MNKSIIAGGILVIGIGAASAPYFIGKGIESEIINSIKEMDKTGITIENTTKASYFETTSDGKIIVDNGVYFFENLARNYENELVGQRIQKLLDETSKNDKKGINNLLNGLEIKYTSTIDNLSSSTIINGYISKLPDAIEKEINYQISKSDVNPFAKKIESMIHNKKFAFTFNDGRLKIHDIKETVSNDGSTFNFNLSGLNFGQKDTILKTFNIDFGDNRRDDLIMNFDNLKLSYDIKDSKNYENNLKVDKMTFFAKNEIDLNLENFNATNSVKTNDNRANVDFSVGVDKVNLVNNQLNGILNKTDFKINADLDAKSLEVINNIDFSNDKTSKKDLERAIESILLNTPNLKIDLDLNGMVIDGQELGSQVKVNADLKLIKINEIEEIQRALRGGRQSLVKYLNGSSIRVLGDDKTTNSVAQVLLAEGIRPTKSKTEGFNEVVATVKNGLLYINEKQMF